MRKATKPTCTGPRSPRLAFACMFGLPAFATSCFFQANVDNGAAQITCGDDVDCPPSWTCRSGLCGAPVDVLPPRIVDVSFDPSIARANVPVRLTIVADEELGADPVLSFSGDVDDGVPRDIEPLPGGTPDEPDAVVDDSEALAGKGFFVLLERSGARAVYERTFAPADADNASVPIDLSLTLESVTLEDVEGNHGDAVVPVSAGRLFVDRSPPLLRRISADGERFSAVAPFSEVRATVEIEEYLTPPASLAVLLGDQLLSCLGTSTATGSAGDGVGQAPIPPEPFVCGGFVDDTTPEGTVVLQAVASDAAGNIAVVGTSVIVDRTPPSAASVATVTISGQGAAATLPTMVAGATVTLDVVASEPLAAADIAGVFATAELDLAEVVFAFTTEIDGSARERIRATYRVEPLLPVATYRADAVLVDDVGNTSPVLSLALATPLVVSEGVPSPCVATQADDGAPQGVCTDFDHDGFAGRSPVCSGASASDCHDDDPFVHPGADAFDIPGDFTDNACNGSQGAPLDESTAVFVSPQGDDDAPGTRAAPKRSLRSAIAALDDVVVSRRAVALQAGAYADEDEAPLVVAGTTPFSLIGGFDAAWLSGGGETVVTKTCGAAEDDGAAIVAAGPLYAVDVTVDAGACPRSFDAPALFLRRAVVRGACDAVVDGCYVGGVVPVFAWRSRFEGVRIFATTLTALDSTLQDGVMHAADVDVVRTRIFGTAQLSGERARIISSVVDGALSFSESLETYHATLSSARIFASPATTAYLDNSLLVMSETIWDEEPAGPAITVRGSDLFAPCVTPSCNGTVEQCTFPGCAQSTFSFSAAPLLDVDGVHLTPQSPLINAGVENSVNLGAPTSSAGDIDGQCRFNAVNPDIGADET